MKIIYYKLFIFIIFFIMISNCYSYVLKISVMDNNTMDPIANASIKVVIDGKKFYGITDSEGIFELDFSSPRIVGIRCSFIGYESDIALIAGNSDASITFYLESIGGKSSHYVYYTVLKRNVFNWCLSIGLSGNYHFDKTDNLVSPKYGYGGITNLRLIFGKNHKKHSHFEHGITFQFNYSRTGKDYDLSGSLNENEIGIIRDDFSFSSFYCMYPFTKRKSANRLSSPFLSLGGGISYSIYKEFRGTLLSKFIDSIPYAKKDTYKNIGLNSYADIGYINVNAGFSWSIFVSAQSVNVLNIKKYPIFLSLNVAIGTTLK